jgi:hypothetical protein
MTTPAFCAVTLEVVNFNDALRRIPTGLLPVAVRGGFRRYA